jgi:NADH:ubiquinone oxidoreductase subunit F (NADH-binding)
MAEGHELYAYLPGGASGGILPARLADVPLDFDTLQPTAASSARAAVIVLSQHDRARDAALNMMRFFADESCGQCTPCRVGTAKAATLMEAPQWDKPRWTTWPGDGRRQHLRPGPGRAQPHPLRAAVLCRTR